MTPTAKTKLTKERTTTLLLVHESQLQRLWTMNIFNFDYIQIPCNPIVQNM